MVILDNFTFALDIENHPCIMVIPLEDLKCDKMLANEHSIKKR